MRRNQVGVITIEYPEDILWSKDHNYIKLISDNKVGAEITITHPNGEDTKTLKYISQMKELVFYLDDVIYALNDDNTSNYTVDIVLYYNGAQYGTFTFTFKVLTGKTFNDRTHGVEQHIYLGDVGMNKVDIYSPSDGRAMIGNSTYSIVRGKNTLNLSGELNTYGEHKLTLLNPASASLTDIISSAIPIDPYTVNVSFSAHANYSTPIYGGDVFGIQTIFPITHTIEVLNTCASYPLCELMYIDTDGMYRFMYGKVLNDTHTINASGYTKMNADTIIADEPYRVFESADKVIKVIFTDIKKSARFEDIMYSDLLRLTTLWDGNTIPVKLKKSEVTVTGDEYNNYEIEIYTLD